MTMRYIPGAAAISEFVAGYNGDCGETAEMAALHTINPTAYPLNAADLSTLVKRDISRGWASANGSEPLSAIANDLGVLGVAHTNYGYAEPFTADWRGQLAQFGGVKPIIFEYAHAGQLPGDEPGVAYHFNTCLAWDTATGAGLFADGDNAVERSGGTALVPYTEAELAAAGLCGMLTLDYLIGGAAMAGVPAGWTDSNGILKAPNGVTCQHGIRQFVLDSSWDSADVPVCEEIDTPIIEYGNQSLGGGAIQYFLLSGQVSWTTARGTFRTWNGQEEYALRRLLENTLAALKAAQNAPAPAPVPVPAPVAPPVDPVIAAKAAALDALFACYGVK